MAHEVGPMGLNNDHIIAEYGTLQGYHDSVSSALMALASLDVKLSKDAEENYLAIVENHISVLGGLLVMGLTEMEPSQVLSLAVSKGLLDDE